MNRSRKNKSIQIFGVALFFIVLISGFLLGLCMELRPKESEREKRMLEEFPKITFDALWNGTFWNDVSEWYSDTYPCRDFWLDLNNKVQNLYGIRTFTVKQGGNQTGDVIPEAPAENSRTENSETADGEEENWGETENVSELSENDKEISGQESKQESSKEESVLKLPDDPKQIEADIAAKIQDGLIVLGDAAYTQYYFSLTNANIYINMMNRVADELAGQTNVYSILIPNNTQILLDDDTIQSIGGSNEQQAIDYYYGSMNERVHTVESFRILKEHKDEYLFYRTDHHWTALGAYYVYRNFAAEKGVTAHELSQFEYRNFGEFLGSYYSSTMSAAMEANPDYVEAYVPMGTNKMTFTDTDGVETEWNVIFDVSDWAISSKYNTFIGGDNPFDVIENPQITDGSSCLLVKESYGNAFAPYLVDHYQYIYVIDYRYYQDNILDFIKEKEIDDFILINNIATCSSDYVVSTLDSKLS